MTLIVNYYIFVYIYTKQISFLNNFDRRLKILNIVNCWIVVIICTKDISNWNKHTLMYISMKLDFRSLIKNIKHR